MADIPLGIDHDGNHKVSWVPTIADISAPTVAELNAGISLECQITPDGLSIEASDDDVDTSRLCSKISTGKKGRTTYNASVTLFKLDPSEDDDAYDTMVKGAIGHLVRRDNLDSDTAWAAGQTVDVFPFECGTRNKSTPAPNEQQKFTVPFGKTLGEPALDAVVAA